MEKVVRVFDSFSEADAATDRERREMTPAERVDIFFALQQRGPSHASEQRLARVCRVLELQQS
jgi:hypothetical protein